MSKFIKICQYCFDKAENATKEKCKSDIPCIGATMGFLFVCRDCRQEKCTCKKKEEYENFNKSYRKNYLS